MDSTVWNHQLWLDPYEKYSLKWNINSENQTITFLCEVQTRGWIGFGISPNGGMKASDLIIAWVDDNSEETHFDDRYASGEYLPEIDLSQDWFLIDSRQNSTHTVIQFSRPLITCDTNRDRDITRDTIRLIYAYSDFDPKSLSDIRIHGIHQRGGKNVLLLSDIESQDREPKESDLKSIVINVNNITIPKNKTTYWCKLIKLDREKIHIVKYRPYITRGSEPYTHHMSIFSCVHPDHSQLDQFHGNKGYDCTDTANMPKDLLHCFSPYLLWAVGGGAFILPEDVAFPLADDLSNTYLLLNIHYDNPEEIAGVVDSSGFELFYTKQFRKYEASTLSVASALDNRFFIPPHQKEFHVTGHCHTKCFQNVMDANGLHAFAILPHAHLLGRKIKTRHFRGNQELPWIEFDQNYDFNLQPFRSLDPMVEIRPGDQLTVECTYDSTDRNTTAFGGFGTSDEMCTSFLFYYPKMRPSKPCFSALTDQTTRKLSDIRDSQRFDSISDFNEYLSEKHDWNQNVLNNSYDIMLNAKQKLECYWIKTDSDLEFDELLGYPDVDQIYTPPIRECVSYEDYVIESTIGSHLIIFIIILILLITMAVSIAVYLYRRRPTYRNRLV